jgi:vitamin B12 transporter
MECAMMIRLSYILFFFILINKSIAADIPIIVISAGKAPQSKSTIGSDVTIIDSNVLAKSNEYFVGDILSENIMGMNYFQSGGYGTTSGIQLRGQPKRYSTVYINGIKLSDPSTPSNDYYFGNLMNNSFESIEVLKGSQSTLYGSGAIAGTINLFTKKGREGQNQSAEISEGSFGTRNLNASFDGTLDKFDYFVNITNFSSDGISARVDDDENDRYRNDNYEGNFGYQINNNIRFETYFNYADSFLEYDSVNLTHKDDNSTDDQQTLFSSKFIIDIGNLKNTFSYNRTYILREVMNYNSTINDEQFEGRREAFGLVGQYNLNLDTRIVYGLDHEIDTAEKTSYYWLNGGSSSTYKSDLKYIEKEEDINSQYVDLQLRPTEKMYSTIGLRRDNHSLAGEYYTQRATMAYKLESNLTLRSSLGTGIRFPALNEYYFGATVADSSTLKPEESISFDIGFDKKYPNRNLDFSTTLFMVEYENYIGGWASNKDSGNSYVQKNTDATNKSHGIELSSNWKPSKDIKVDLGYVRTFSYDGSTCSNTDDYCDNSMNVRIPSYVLSSGISKVFGNNVTGKANFKYVGERRDYGGADNSFRQVMLDEYMVIDLSANYNMGDYKMNFSLKNLFDEDYQEVNNYSTLGRNLNFRINRKF